MNWQDGVAYAHSVAKGEINVCRDVRLACQRFINQYENKEWEYVFDPITRNTYWNLPVR
jgi:hypothetical protein